MNNMSFDFGFLVPSQPTLFDILLANKNASSNDIRKILENNLDYDINNPRENGETVLHYACYSGWTSLVDVLLDFGGNINKVDSKNRTPLGILAHLLQEDNQYIFKKCLEYGGDCTLAYADYSTILRKAKHQNRYAAEAIIDYDISFLTLKGSGANDSIIKTQFSGAVYSYLLDKGKIDKWQSQLEIVEINKGIDLSHLYTTNVKPKKRLSV